MYKIMLIRAVMTEPEEIDRFDDMNEAYRKLEEYRREYDTNCMLYVSPDIIRTVPEIVRITNKYKNAACDENLKITGAEMTDIRAPEYSLSYKYVNFIVISAKLDKKSLSKILKRVSFDEEYKTKSVDELLQKGRMLTFFKITKDNVTAHIRVYPTDNPNNIAYSTYTWLDEDEAAYLKSIVRQHFYEIFRNLPHATQDALYQYTTENAPAIRRVSYIPWYTDINIITNHPDFAKNALFLIKYIEMEQKNGAQNITGHSIFPARVKMDNGNICWEISDPKSPSYPLTVSISISKARAKHILGYNIFIRHADLTKYGIVYAFTPIDEKLDTTTANGDNVYTIWDDETLNASIISPDKKENDIVCRSVIECRNKD